MRYLLLFTAVLSLLATGCSITSPPAVGPAEAAPPQEAPDPVDDPSPGPGSDVPVSTPAPTPSSEPPDPDSGSTGMPFPADTSPDTSPGRGMPVTLVDVRTGTHPGFDRVVFDLRGDGRAGWHVRYVDEARAQGSGDPVEVAGGAILEVDLSHTGYPDDTGVEFYDGPRRIAGSTVVLEVVLTGMYEGHTQLFVGVAEQRPFRVHAVDGRVILDILHGG